MSSKSSDSLVSDASQVQDLSMSPDRMLDLAMHVAKLLVERSENLRDQGAWEGDFRQELERKLLEDPPEEGHVAEEVIDRVVTDVLPFATRLDHPRCFAFIPSAPTWPSVLADFMAAGFNINACTWLVASGPSQLELVVIDWFRKWIGYPDTAGGILTSGGSSASVSAFVAAREAAGNPDSPVVYMSNQSHSAQVRAARIIGISAEHIRLLDVDENFRLDMAALRRSVTEDRNAGLNPIAICANAGATSQGAIDSLEELADYAEAEGIWLHTDAAYGGFAVLTEKGKKLLRGIERSDSIVLDAHKSLFQPYEVGGLLVKDVASLENTFSVHHDVLQDTIWGANHPNFSDRSYQLSRGTRALKVWVSIQTFGLGAFRRAIDEALDLAQRAGEFVRECKALEQLAPVSLGILCFRVNSNQYQLDEETLNGINHTVLARVFWEDQALVSSTQVRGAFALRLCIINHNTCWDDVRDTLMAIEQFGEQELAKQSVVSSFGG